MGSYSRRERREPPAPGQKKSIKKHKKYAWMSPRDSWKGEKTRGYLSSMGREHLAAALKQRLDRRGRPVHS